MARDLVNERKGTKGKLVDERKGMKGKLVDERKGKPVRRKSGGLVEDTELVKRENIRV